MIMPWWFRWAALAALCAAVALYTGIKVAGHYQDKLAAIQAVGVAQAKHTKAVEVQQGKVVKDVQRETKSAIDRSDAYYRLRLNPSSGALSNPARPASSPPAAPATTPPNTNDCSMADGAADALLVLGWQKFYSDLQAAQK